ncbi:MAG: hypothetical protein RQ856_00825 [Candidatus Izemoplasmatales bacterium]|nr:hypothetical protein [Candidatus Izemoplasmatales bacterium]
MIEMTFINKIKEFFNKPKSTKNDEIPNYVSLTSMEMKYEKEDYLGAAKDLKLLLEAYGRRKRKNHRYKGREFIHFILSNKHKDLKTTGYTHWQNLNQFIKLNHTTVYPYHKNNLRNAMSFFKKEIKGLSEIKISSY